MRRISEKGKQKEKRGTGTGESYKPYIQTREFNSLGTCSNPIDWKTGRSVHLLSQGEDMLWHILRWNDDIADIREQYPLELKRTFEIASQYGLSHPGTDPMTSDFLVTRNDKQLEVYSLKASRDVLESERNVERLFIEKTYWVTQGIPFKLVFKADLNKMLYNNIRLVVPYYNVGNIHDDASVIKHLIATRRLRVDMESKALNIRNLRLKYEKEIDLWKQRNSNQAIY